MTAEQTTTIPFPVRENAERSVSTAALPLAFVSGRARGSIPLFVPRKQLYYWTKEWQNGEAEALEDLVVGEFRTFSSGADAAAWLLADDEE